MPILPVDDDTLVLPDGRHLGYRVRGDRAGTPILHLHGQPGSRFEADVYSDDSLTLAKAWVIAYDRPGMGRTDLVPDRDMLEDLPDPLALLDHLGVERAVIVGVSAGGPPALALTATHPDRVIRTILSSASGPYDDEAYMTEEDIEEHRDLRSRGANALLEDYERSRERILADVDAAMAGWFEDFPPAERAWATRGPGRAVLRRDMTEALRQGARGWLRETEVRARPWTFDPASIRTPVRAFHGSDDAWERLDNLERILFDIPDARLRVIQGGNHLAPLLDIDQVLAAAMGRLG